MIWAKRRVLRKAAATLLGILAACWPQCGNGAGLDCRKARTAVDVAICADANLKRLDEELANNYQSIRKLLVPGGLKPFMDRQRAWVSERNKQCSEGQRDCLVKKYLERNEFMVALLARSSEENPVIDLADSGVLVGIWIVEANVRDSAKAPVLIPVAAHLPPVGARLSAKPGELCVVEPTESKLCSSFGLAVVQPTDKVRADPACSTSVTAVTYFDGKADFDLVLGPDSKVTASYLACEPSGGNCRQATQSWRPLSADATYKVIPIFK